jgi:hypothetical protein
MATTVYSNTLLAEVMSDVLMELVEAGQLTEQLAMTTLEQVWCCCVHMLPVAPDSACTCTYNTPPSFYTLHAAADTGETFLAFCAATRPLRQQSTACTQAAVVGCSTSSLAGLC